MTAGTKASIFCPPSQRPPQGAQRSARARLSEIPRNPRKSFQRKGRSPSFGRFKGGQGGKYEIPPDNLSWEAREDIFLIRKEYPLASR